MLTNQRLSDIERLQKECESHDRIRLKLNWEMLRTRGEEPLEFWEYEDGVLVAFLALYPFGSTVEVCGMVKPGERRKGRFTRLFRQAMEKVSRNGYKKILLNAPAGSEAAKAFLRAQGAEYAFSEHQMEWREKPLEQSDDVGLRPATAEDYELRVRLMVTAFGVDEEDARTMESKGYGENADNLMIDIPEGTVGKIRVSREEGQAWIYGFSVLPEYQGRGIGRNVLRRVIQEQTAAGYSVHLEVETKNDHALKLYESVGFHAVHAQDYYRYRMGEHLPNLDELIGRIIAFRDERNWKQFHDPKDLALSISLESSELLELFQWKTGKQAIEANYSDMKDELADILIYALTLAHDLDIDVRDAILRKMEKNALKYPVSKSKGSSAKYTEMS